MIAKCLEIRSRLLPENHPELAICYHNSATLAGAQGNQQESMELMDHAQTIRQNAGQTASATIALGYLIYGRALFHLSQFEAAEKEYHRTEAMFAVTIGSESHLTAQ
jgi:tetratricopeptide (TPR) repeat protein